MSGAAPPAKLLEQHVLDELIMGTNSSSIVSKRSVENLYYPNEPHYFRYFVKKYQRRAPLINRGYWLRLKAIDVTVQHFLEKHEARKKKLIINLGCGSDVLPWQSHARHAALCDGVMFVDIDYPDLMRKKRSIVQNTPQLREILGQDFIVSEAEESHFILRSERYCQIGCDLRELGKLRAILEELTPLSECPVLFVAEVSITYMDTQSADALIQWASSIGNSEFCLLEQLLPHGPDHPFARTMLNHFDKLNTPPKSVRQYPTLSRQIDRFTSRGFQEAKIWDLWQVWSSEDFVSGAERASLDEIEPFDEWEEFVMFGRHYFIIHASTSSKYKKESLQRRNDSVRQSINTQVSVVKTVQEPKRRFGDAFAPEIRFEPCGEEVDPTKQLSLFGAKPIEFGSYTLVCGGVGERQESQGQTIVAIDIDSQDRCNVSELCWTNNEGITPLMIGSSVMRVDDNIMVFGGGATCFSMGTYWQGGASTISIHNKPTHWKHSKPIAEGLTRPQFMGSQRFVSGTSRSQHQGSKEVDATITTVARTRLETPQQLRDILEAAVPVIIAKTDIGDCVWKWTSSYMIDRVGHDTQVVIHECQQDSEKMDFNSKNFRYVTESFENVIRRAEAGHRVYLRALSREKPMDRPANIKDDFPGIASDFHLPNQMDSIQNGIFSSVLRVSGRVNMWLHYDVMANMYAQVVGSKRMVLFPPSDVGHLAFAPGASSSSLDVFSELRSSRMNGTHPHEAMLEPGDILYLPPLWLHAATTAAIPSIAVNVFFRNLNSGYAAGRDVYGNRDLAAYEKGRLDVGRIGKSFQKFPMETRRFYLNRLAGELELAADGV
ncbi:hypothetical protein C2857_001345 [Epichloe festucae Fl1]|uniref:tRNA wybutosine-synthesizing protein 4 n=1 Tax=Epichloe festucae (strain Fl1) TaxID=877507 RepID=A0A7U3PZT9_EPIFF|nr:hypothetical protein C2857_001345 [Epichloe festucae Fl1]